MIRLRRLILLLSFCLLFPSLAGATDCENILLPPHFGIGVLAKTRTGQLFIGISSYAGSFHHRILRQMFLRLPLAEILWMGEMTYRIEDGKPLLFEANETSGHYWKLKTNKIANELGVPITNNFTQIPDEIQAPSFRAWAYGTGPNRIVKELREIDDDVRHDIGNALSIVPALARLIQLAGNNFEKKREILALVRRTSSERVRLMRWLIQHLEIDNRLPPSQVSVTKKILEYISDLSAGFEGIEALDLNAVDEETKNIVNVIDSPYSDEEDSLVKLYPLEDPSHLRRSTDR